MSDNSRATLAPEYSALWEQCQPGPRPPQAPSPQDATTQINSTLAIVQKGKARYQSVEASSGVPWWFVGVLHMLEASGDFSRHIHNGDPLTARTVHVPAGRPVAGNPPFSWEFSTNDAMTWKEWTPDTVRRLPDGSADWTLPTVLWRLEGWNGFGYRNKGVRSPYLWAGCNLEQPGRYVADGSWNPDTWSKQIGAAVLLKTMVGRGDIIIQGA